MGKEKTISFKIEEAAKDLFEKYCEDNHTTPSHELRLFIHNKNKSNDKRISLTEYAQKQKQ